MTQMRLEFDDSDGVMTFHLTTTDGPQGALTTLTDTAHGVEVKTTLTDSQGGSKVIVDKVDRATPPLHQMLEAWDTFSHSLLHNAQAAFNRARYERLKREGTPITLQTMCMDGQHTGPEYADVPFNGGIVGVPEHHENEPQTPPSEPTHLSDQLMSDLGDILGHDDEEEAA
jgi:hypothetical protein